jgi:hypothetical protein
MTPVSSKSCLVTGPNCRVRAASNSESLRIWGTSLLAGPKCRRRSAATVASHTGNMIKHTTDKPCPGKLSLEAESAFSASSLQILHCDTSKSSPAGSQHGLRGGERLSSRALAGRPRPQRWRCRRWRRRGRAAAAEWRRGPLDRAPVVPGQPRPPRHARPSGPPRRQEPRPPVTTEKGPGPGPLRSLRAKQ